MTWNFSHTTDNVVTHYRASSNNKSLQRNSYLNKPIMEGNHFHFYAPAIWFFVNLSFKKKSVIAGTSDSWPKNLKPRSNKPFDEILFGLLICLSIDPCAKNMTQVNPKFLLMKSYEKYFIFLPAFYLIMWLMISPMNFEKIAIFKIRQLVFFWGGKIHFGMK